MRASKPLGLLTLVAAFAALSNGPLVQGYSTNNVKWATSSVLYYVNAQSRWVSQNAAVSAVQTAAAAWSDQTQANVELVYAGSTNGSALTLNYKNEVFFRDASNGGNVAEVYWWADGNGKIIDADMVFWEGAYQFFVSSGCAAGIYVENAGTHEFGHVLGLNHSGVSGATMQPSMSSYCDRTWMTLEADDIAGIESLYPPSSSGPSNSAPSVSISAPGNNSSFAEGATITFSGSANDSQDGNLSSSLQWTSNLSGQIGTGGSFSRSLVVGSHVITAAVTDSGGLTSSRQVNVTVTAAPPPPPPPSGASLSAHGYKVKGTQKADLGWSGLTSATVDVKRNGAKIATVANSGAMTDHINKKGGGSYSYQVCAAGTATCSNTASVVF